MGEKVNERRNKRWRVVRVRVWHRLRVRVKVNVSV